MNFLGVLTRYPLYLLAFLRLAQDDAKRMPLYR